MGRSLLVLLLALTGGCQTVVVERPKLANPCAVMSCQVRIDTRTIA